MDAETLEIIGLTRGEADVYLTLLKLGNTSSGNIIKASRVSRSKVYDVLERLKQKGLVAEVIKANVRYFEATDPRRIIDYLERKKELLAGAIEKSRKIVADLNKLRSLELEKQEAKIYTGIEGLKTVYAEILEELSKGGEYLAFGIGKRELQEGRISAFFRNFHVKRAERKIKARILMQSGTEDSMKQFSDLQYYSYRFTGTKFPTNIAIWKNSVLTLVWEDKPIAFVIKSKQTAEKYREYFEQLWKVARR